jgi:hypothetical protein
MVTLPVAATKATIRAFDAYTPFFGACSHTLLWFFISF